jgi:hypothetical protein
MSDCSRAETHKSKEQMEHMLYPLSYIGRANDESRTRDRMFVSSFCQSASQLLSAIVRITRRWLRGER